MTNESTKRKWTGGKWRAKRCEAGLFIESERVESHITADVIDHIPIAKVYDEANAHLIAAAPVQHEALSIVGNLIEDSTLAAVRDGGKAGLYFTLEELQQIQAALSAALGEGE